MGAAEGAVHTAQLCHIVRWVSCPPHPHLTPTLTTHTHAHLTDRECPHNRSSLQIYKKPTVIPLHFIPHYITLSLAANTSPLTSSNLAPSPSLPSPQCMGHCPLPLPPVRPVSSPLPALCNKVAGRAQTVCLVLPHPKGQHRKHADLGKEFSGRPHCGLDDAVNIVTILQQLLEDGCILKYNQFLQAERHRPK